MTYVRRDVLKLVGMLAGQRLWGQGGDDDAAGIKIAHRIDWKGLTDDDLLFFQQIGLKWARVEFGAAEMTLDQLRAAQVRFGRFGMKIFSGVHYSYRTTRLQLGQAGRDEDIEVYQRFLRNMGGVFAKLEKLSVEGA